jgi:hypothetical protein
VSTAHTHEPHAHPHAQHHHTAYGGPVVLDVGGEVGALVLHARAAQSGAEIEISPIDDPARRQHVAVHPRDLGGHTIYAAVYPELLSGVYQLWSESGDAVLEVTVPGGRVVEATWPIGA